ncbi:MBL fold metallo-hydrolase [Terrimonas sp.]|uniref:MBL fold metallo-hydrolase n=1 Tax=Terrimonas sp. TaxID=1914338 RepID=UPI000D50D932|nr:MBL fold metallo-hydrolase [Terrimonas sp.]PVD53108.1 MBL fold metallo-hydrolase [Terrimonas sp.]
MLFLIIAAAAVFIIYLFFQQTSFGEVPSGKRLERIKKSPHYKNNSFQNLSETKTMQPGVSIPRIIKEMFFTKHPNRSPHKALPFIRPSYFPQAEDTPEITWFGHSSYLLQVDGVNVLVDPVFSERVSPVSYAGSKAFEGSNAFSIDDLPGIDIIVITHDHYDHLDYTVIKKLKNYVPLFITSLGVGAHLEYWGVPAKKIVELDWWESYTTKEGLEFTATPARHFSGRNFSRNKTLWSSFVLVSKNSKIFIGGDSGYDTHFALIGEKYGPFDIAILENGQYNEMWPNIHMFPEETVQAAIDLKASALLPVHWAKFSLSTHTWHDPIDRLMKAAHTAGVNIIHPSLGERIPVNSTTTNQWWSGRW